MASSAAPPCGWNPVTTETWRSAFRNSFDEVRPIRADFVADGELVVLDEHGRPQWNRLHKRHMLRDPARIERAATADPACIFSFDLLSLHGADFRQRPLLERKTALHRTLPANRRIRFARHLVGDCPQLWEMAVRLDFEGIVAKDARSVYTAGRTNAWQKIKTLSVPSGKSRAAHAEPPAHRSGGILSTGGWTNRAHKPRAP